MAIFDLGFNFINRALEASSKKVGVWIDEINDINLSNMSKIKSNFELTESELNNKESIITTSTASTYWNGLKVFTDFATSVRNSVLTGLSIATTTAVLATDNVLSAIGKLQGQLNLKAPINSPTLTGTPTAPTNTTPGTNNTQIATTAFVHQKFKLKTTNDFTTSDLQPGQWGGVY